MKNCSLRLLSLLVASLLALMPLLAVASPSAPVEGQDYEIIPSGKPFAPVKGRIEVAEVFSYACVHCAHFESSLQAWKRRQPTYVKLTPVPAALSSAWVPYARAYFAAEASGLLGRTHNAVFTALHETGGLPRNPSVDELATFYAGFGADRTKFAALLRSPQIDTKLEQARKFAIASGVDGTPAVIVNGKYRVTGGATFEDVLRITDWLVARERAGAR